MVIQEQPVLVLILSRIEFIISDLKNQHPDISDEDLINLLKKNFLSRE